MTGDEAAAIVAVLRDPATWRSDTWRQQAFAGVESVEAVQDSPGSWSVVVDFTQADRRYVLVQRTMTDFLDLECDATGIAWSIVLTVEEPHGALPYRTSDGRYLFDDDGL